MNRNIAGFTFLDDCLLLTAQRSLAHMDRITGGPRVFFNLRSIFNICSFVSPLIKRKLNQEKFPVLVELLLYIRKRVL